MYTGLPSVFYSILLNHTLKEKSSVPSHFQEFILTLMKLRLDVPLQDLAYRFNISIATVNRIFHCWIDIMDRRLSSQIVWPEREDLWRPMPKCFQYSLLARAQTFSNYKHHNTLKVLLGITPQGSISFVSKTWGGRTSDKNLRTVAF